VSAITESSLSSLGLLNIEYSDLEFKEKVGSGGFGTVSKGRWIPKNKIVAIKMLMDVEEREVILLGYWLGVQGSVLARPTPKGALPFGLPVWPLWFGL